MSKTTNKGNIGHYKYEGPYASSNERFTMIMAPPKDSKHMIFYKFSNLTTSEDSQPMISYRLVSHCKPLGPIISEL